MIARPLVAIAAILIAAAVHGQEVATLDPALICGLVDGMSYSRQHRKLLLEDERQADFARWNVPWSDHRNYELDHIIPLDIGGADTPENRRPQRCDRWEGIRCTAGPAYEKDLLEAQAARDVCTAYRRRGSQTAEPLVKAWQQRFREWRY
jgi:hypothetical protein